MTDAQLRAHARTAINARLVTIEQEREALHAQIAELDFADATITPTPANLIPDLGEPTTPPTPKPRKTWSKAARLAQRKRTLAMWAAKRKAKR